MSVSSPAVPAAAALCTPTSPTDAVTSAAVDDEAERVMLCLRLSDARSSVSRQQRAIARIRGKLSGVSERKAPLLASLQSELSSQQAAISQLRASLAQQQAAFSSDAESGHSVYESALRAIDANSRAALVGAEAEVSRLLEASNELASFALVEAALQSKCGQLARKNADNECKHAQRMADMRRQWDDSRAALKQAAAAARHDSERRYKQQVMAAINISYARMGDSIDSMAHSKQAEGRQLRRLHDAIAVCRQAIGEERGRERAGQQRRADSARSLLDAKLQLSQLGRDISHEQHKLAKHSAAEAARRQQTRDERQCRQWRLQSDLRGWQGVRAVCERSVTRLRAVVDEVSRARSANPFQQLVEECIRVVSTSSSTQSAHDRVAVAALGEEARQRMLRLLFVRIRQAETQCAQRERGQAGARETEPVETAQDDSAVEVAQAEAAHSGPSFFLTQHQPEQT